MFKLAAAALLCALLLSLIARRRGGPHWARFALGSFAFFALITASFWILSPDGTARTVQADASGALMLQIVQGRGAVVLPFGLATLAAAWAWPHRRLAAMLGPFAYNALMTVEATRAQFTPLATPERWIYVTLHGLWAISLAVYCLGLDRRLPRGAVPGACAGAVPVLIGATLYGAPLAVIGGAFTGAATPLLLHSAHAFGASLVGLGLVSFSWWSGLSDRIGQGLCLLASALLAALAATGGYWLPAALALGWGLAHLLPRPAPAAAPTTTAVTPA
jgi:hypothetical protein